MKNLLVIALVAIIPACKSSKASPKGEPAPKQVEAAPAVDTCDTALPALMKQLEAHETAIAGKQVTLHNCKFGGYGPHSLWLSTFAGTKHDLDCEFAKDDSSNQKFYEMAVEHDDKDKLELDVTAKVAERDGALVLTECQITSRLR